MHMYISFYRRISTMNELIYLIISDFCYGFFSFQNVVVFVFSFGVESLFSFEFGCMELRYSGLIDALLISVGYSVWAFSVVFDALFICKVGCKGGLGDALLVSNSLHSR